MSQEKDICDNNSHNEDKFNQFIAKVKNSSNTYIDNNKTSN